MKQRDKGSALPSLLFCFWLASAGAGFIYLTSYHLAPSAAANVPSEWPASTQLTLHDSHYTLVMLLHPKCACSQASVSELMRIAAKVGELLEPKIVFVAESDQLKAVRGSVLWEQAIRIPKIQILIDSTGSEAEFFGSLTSGQVALYDPQGVLHFQGGITASRGHEGDNLGAESIIKLIRTKNASYRNTPVFGCGLRDEEQGAI